MKRPKLKDAVNIFSDIIYDYIDELENKITELEDEINSKASEKMSLIVKQAKGW